MILQTIRASVLEPCRRTIQRRALRRARRVVLGSGGLTQDQWFATDRDLLDLGRPETFTIVWPEPSVTHFLAEHVWEHLTPEEARTGVRLCAAALVPRGRLRIAVPDGAHPSADYIASVRPGGTGAGADDHKVLYTVESLCALLREDGLLPHPLEWWDAEGRFHGEPWSPEDGMVRRSAEHDRRNAEEPLSYTSLIVDGIKPDHQAG